jgi:hypothetical protein
LPHKLGLDTLASHTRPGHTCHTDRTCQIRSRPGYACLTNYAWAHLPHILGLDILATQTGPARSLLCELVYHTIYAHRFIIQGLPHHNTRPNSHKPHLPNIRQIHRAAPRMATASPAFASICLCCSKSTQALHQSAPPCRPSYQQWHAGEVRKIAFIVSRVCLLIKSRSACVCRPSCRQWHAGEVCKSCVCVCVNVC